MDFRIVLVAFLGAVGIYFLLDETMIDSGGAVARSELNPMLRQACELEPEMCECVYPVLQVIGEDDELMALVTEIGFSGLQGADAQAMAMERVGTLSPRTRARLFEAFGHVDLAEMMTCMSRTNPAFREMVRSPSPRAIREMSD